MHYNQQWSMSEFIHQNSALLPVASKCYSSDVHSLQFQFHFNSSFTYITQPPASSISTLQICSDTDYNMSVHPKLLFFPINTSRIVVSKSAFQHVWNTIHNSHLSECVRLHIHITVVSKLIWSTVQTTCIMTSFNKLKSYQAQCIDVIQQINPQKLTRLPPLAYSITRYNVLSVSITSNNFTVINNMA